MSCHLFILRFPRMAHHPEDSSNAQAGNNPTDTANNDDTSDDRPPGSMGTNDGNNNNNNGNKEPKEHEPIDEAPPTAEYNRYINATSKASKAKLKDDEDLRDGKEPRVATPVPSDPPAVAQAPDAPAVSAVAAAAGSDSAPANGGTAAEEPAQPFRSVAANDVRIDEATGGGSNNPMAQTSANYQSQDEASASGAPARPTATGSTNSLQHLFEQPAGKTAGKPPMAPVAEGAGNAEEDESLTQALLVSTGSGAAGFPSLKLAAAQRDASFSSSLSNSDDDTRTEEDSRPVFDLLDIVLSALRDINVTDAVVTPDATGTWVTVTFTVTGFTRKVVTAMAGLGIGDKFGTVCVLDVPMRHPVQKPPPDDGDEAARSSIVLTVDRVLREAKAKARVSFDYSVLLIVAATIAGLGLATNNTVAIVASMLVSPLMGPIMAATFGSVTREWSTVRVGATTEILSLAVCIFIGIIIGLVFGLTGWSNDWDWPTIEMSGRGEPSSVILGVVIGFVSGIGAAVSIIGSDSVGLVGVAISASLLPPAVNTGMLLSYAWITTGTVVTSSGDSYSSSHLGTLCGYSFLLVVVNIACIYVGAYGTYKFKEVAPIPNKSEFWKQGVQKYRAAEKLSHEEVKKWLKERRERLSKRDNALAATGKGHGAIRPDQMPFNRFSTVNDLLGTKAADSVVEPSFLKPDHHRRVSLDTFRPPTAEEIAEARRSRNTEGGGPDGQGEDSSEPI